MPTGAGSGIFLGLEAAERERRRRGTSKGDGSVFNTFPKLLLAIIAYAIVGYVTVISGGGLEAFVGDMAAFRTGECAGMINAGPEAEVCRQGVLNRALFSVPMVGEGRWILTASDLFIMLGLLLLFFELLKAPGTGNATVLNNMFSTLVFVAALLLFILLPVFATSTFFIIVLMALVDTSAGWYITVISSRRDLAVGGE